MTDEVISDYPVGSVWSCTDLVEWVCSVVDSDVSVGSAGWSVVALIGGTELSVYLGDSASVLAVDVAIEGDWVEDSSVSLGVV